MEVYFNKTIGKYKKDTVREIPDSLARIYLSRRIASKHYERKVMEEPVDQVPYDDIEELREKAKSLGLNVHHRAGRDKILQAIKEAKSDLAD